MSIDYLVAALPALKFDEKPAITGEELRARCGAALDGLDEAWKDLDVQLRNALAEARGGGEYCKSAEGCSLYWKARVNECFQEKDVMKRETALDRVRWDAAGELTEVSSPLGRGALYTYAIRLGIAEKRSRISSEAGKEIFNRSLV